ncbi:DEAD/DEAH box helicase, partial [Paenibacillus enshidis]
MTAYFSKLAPFIQEYIYRKKWEKLQETQVEAVKVILETENHVLIAAGTASGKTEAALFPALTDLYHRPSASIGILYIAPLKALINDQFDRLQELLKEGNIPVAHWHGDVSRSEKLKVMKHPAGILQITPESLEGLLMNHPAAIQEMFHDLRYVVIDEMHAFMAADRGAQLLCQLGRIEKLASCRPCRIGLSATLSDYKGAAAWLGSGSTVPVKV